MWRGGLRARAAASELLQRSGPPARGSHVSWAPTPCQLGASAGPADVPLPVPSFFEYLLLRCSPREASRLSAPDAASPRSRPRGREERAVPHLPPLGFASQGIFALLGPLPGAPWLACCRCSAIKTQVCLCLGFPELTLRPPREACSGPGLVPVAAYGRRRGASEGHAEPPLSEACPTKASR